MERRNKIKNYQVKLSENGWEYTGHISIDAEDITQVNKTTLIINGATVVFDEEVMIVH